MARCCVLIPYYEDGDELLHSITSIESSSPVDVLVVDDGSRVRPAAGVLRRYTGPLSVAVIETSSNGGIAAALNQGIEELKGRYEYIARLDCADVCVNDRIDRQIRYLDGHPGCMLVGSWVEFVAPTGRYLYTMRHPADRAGIRRTMHVNCAFTHPSVMFRASVFDQVGDYPLTRPAAEDFALFLRITARYDVANIPLPLVRCTIDPDGISTRQRRRQLRSRIAILLEHFAPTPLAIYGLARAVVQLAVAPRGVTVIVNAAREFLGGRNRKRG